MNTAELKLEIFREVDSLDKSKLLNLYGYIRNSINIQTETEEWLNLSAEQKSGLIAAIDDLDSGNGIPNDEVMKRYKSTYLTY